MPVDNDGYPYQPVPTLVTNGFTSRPILKVACGGVHNLAITMGDNTLVQCLSHLFNNAADMHADIAFILEGGDYVCAHMCILKARCRPLFDYAQSRHSSDVTSTVQVSDDKRIPGVLIEAKKSAFQDFLHFVYSSKLVAFQGRKSSPMSHIIALYHLASRFHVIALLPLCRQAVRRQLARDKHRMELPTLFAHAWVHLGICAMLGPEGRFP